MAQQLGRRARAPQSASPLTRAQRPIEAGTISDAAVAPAARLRPLRFHDLRHTFGTRVIAKADIRRVQECMGHADVATTMKHLHYLERPDEVALVAAAFAGESAASHAAGSTRRPA